MSADFTPKMRKQTEDWLRKQGFYFNKQFPLVEDDPDNQFIKEFPDLSISGWGLYKNCTELGLSLSDEKFNSLLHRIEDYTNEKDNLKDLDQKFVSKLKLWYNGKYVPGYYQEANDNGFAYCIKEYLKGENN